MTRRQGRWLGIWLMAFCGCAVPTEATSGTSSERNSLDPSQGLFVRSEVDPSPEPPPINVAEAGTTAAPLRKLVDVTRYVLRASLLSRPTGNGVSPAFCTGPVVVQSGSKTKVVGPGNPAVQCLHHASYEDLGVPQFLDFVSRPYRIDGSSAGDFADPLVLSMLAPDRSLSSPGAIHFWDLNRISPAASFGFSPLGVQVIAGPTSILHDRFCLGGYAPGTTAVGPQSAIRCDATKFTPLIMKYANAYLPVHRFHPAFDTWIGDYYNSLTRLNEDVLTTLRRGNLPLSQATLRVPGGEDDAGRGGWIQTSMWRPLDRQPQFGATCSKSNMKLQNRPVLKTHMFGLYDVPAPPSLVPIATWALGKGLPGYYRDAKGIVRVGTPDVPLVVSVTQYVYLHVDDATTNLARFNGPNGLVGGTTVEAYAYFPHLGRLVTAWRYNTRCKSANVQPNECDGRYPPGGDIGTTRHYFVNENFKPLRPDFLTCATTVP